MVNSNIVIVGSSGAGLPILSSIFKNMPLLHGCIILIQHMPVYINQAVRDNLAQQTELTVKLAEEMDPVQPGFLYIAPSELHLKLVHNRQIHLLIGERVNYVCPSIDVAMLSLVSDPHARLVGVLLSGIGEDGVKGIRHIKKLGGVTIALDKKTAPIASMADGAIATGDVDFVLSPDQIRKKLIEQLGKA